MTGFGIGESHLGNGKLAVEIRGVNHRFLDVRVRMPREMGDLSSFVEQIAREKLSRGRYEICVRTEGIPLGSATLDRDRARAAYRAFCDLRDELAPDADVPFSLLASIPDLFVSSVERAIDSIREAIRIGFDNAVKALDAMRLTEGTVLREDLERRLRLIETIIFSVERRAPDVVDYYRKRLRERADRLRSTAEIDVDTNRLEQEVVLFADRVDICEEITRLHSHCAQFATLTAGSEAVGRRLDFLLQEMAREANTVGAKSPDSQISHAIVEVKTEIERLREQVQNVE